jgi:transcriptional regulator with XRE-family HTH domain
VIHVTISARWAIIPPMSLSTTSASVGLAIRAAREGASLPIARVARACGLTALELDGIESGRSRPSIATLDRIARAIGKSLADLVRGGDKASSGPQGGGAPLRLGLPQIARAIAELSVQGGSKIDAAESAAILYAMSVCNDNQSAAARMLAMERKAFVRRLRRAKRRRKE